MKNMKQLKRCGIVCLIAGLSLLASCQSPQVADNGGDVKRSTLKRLANPYAQVAPELLDPTLGPDELDRMFTPLESISSDLGFLTADPNAEPLQIKAPDVPCPDDGRKAYLQGRWLLAKSKVTEAIAELDAALKCDPNSVELIELLARAVFSDRQFHRAEALSREALRLSGDRMYAYQTLGDIYFNQQKYSQSIALYRAGLSCRQANRDNPLTAMIHLNLATSLTAQGYFRAGLVSYQKAYRLLERQRSYSHANPVMGQLAGQAHLLLIARAGLHLQMGEISRAVDLLDETLEVIEDVDLVELFINSLATQRISLELRYRRVVALCEYLLAIDTPAEATVGIFYQACEKMSRLADFTQSLHRWTQRDRGFRPLLDQKGLAYGLSLVDEYGQAEAVLLEALAKDRKSVPLYRDLARLYRQWERWGDMMDAYSDLLTHSHGPKGCAELDVINEAVAEIIYPIEVMEQWQSRAGFSLDFSRSFLLGRLAETGGDEKQAEHFYRKGVSLNREFQMGVRTLCELLLRQGRYQDTLELIEQLNGDSVNDMELLWYAGRAHGGLEQYEQAEAVYRRVLSEDAAHLSDQVVLSLGDVLVKQGAFEKAELIFLEALDKRKHDEAIYPHLLELYGGWNAQEDLTEVLHEATTRQMRKLFRQWLEVQTEKNHEELTDWTRQTVVFESLGQRYPQGRIIHVLLSELYARQGRYVDALSQLEPFLQADGSDEELLTLQAEYYSRSLDFSKASEVYLSLWELSPEDSQRFIKVLTTLRLSDQAERGLGLLLSEETKENWRNAEAIRLLQDESYRLFGITRRYDEAVVLYQDWFGEVKGDDSELSELQQKLVVRLGRKLIWALEQTERLDEALEQMKSLVSDYTSNDLRPVARLVRLLNIQRRFDESLELLAFLLEGQGDDLLLRHQLGFTLILSGQKFQAIEGAEAWLAEDSEDPKRRQLLLVLLQRCGQHAEAIGWLETWQAKSPTEKLVMHQFELLLASGQFERAEALLEDSAVLKNNAGMIFEARIQLATKQGQCEKALSLVDEVTRDPNSSQTNQLKARVLASCGDYEQATEAIDLVIQASSDAVDAKLQKSLFLERIGRIDEAIVVLEALLVDFPNDGAIKNNLGYILVSHHRDLERSGELLEASYRSNPESGATLDSLGWLYYKRGEFELAMRYLHEATASIFQVDEEIWDHLGDTAYRLDRKELAEYYWEQAMNRLARHLASDHEKSVKENIVKKLEQLKLDQPVSVADVFDSAPLAP